MSKENIAEALQKIEQGIEACLDDERWKQYIALMSRLPNYSYGNIMLILAQKPDATMVAGYNAWKVQGRYVKKGEKGIAILAPIIKKAKADAKTDVHNIKTDSKVLSVDPKDNTLVDSGIENQKERVITGFRIVYVFDVSQTDGKPLPELPIQKLSGNSGLYERLLYACPYMVRETADLGGANGTFNPVSKEIKILQGLEEAQKAKTLIHEWAHGILHASQVPNISRKQGELEAESVAYAVCNALGLDTSGYSFWYLSSWGKEDAIKMIKASADRIQKAVDEILTRVTTVVPEMATEA